MRWGEGEGEGESERNGMRQQGLRAKVREGKSESSGGLCCMAALVRVASLVVVVSAVVLMLLLPLLLFESLIPRTTGGVRGVALRGSRCRSGFFFFFLSRMGGSVWEVP